jgi:hypothetical protein
VASTRLLGRSGRAWRAARRDSLGPEQAAGEENDRKLERAAFEGRYRLARLCAQCHRSREDLAREAVSVKGIVVPLMRQGLQGQGHQGEQQCHERGSCLPDPSAGTHALNVAQLAPRGQLALRRRQCIGLATLAGTVVARRLSTESAEVELRPTSSRETAIDTTHLTTPLPRVPVELSTTVE